MFAMLRRGPLFVRSIDIVASATGKIIPSSRVKVIQPFETGVVRAIHVHDGQIPVRAHAQTALVAQAQSLPGASVERFPVTLKEIFLEHVRTQ